VKVGHQAEVTPPLHGVNCLRDFQPEKKSKPSNSQILVRRNGRRVK